jgi:hypothetical protein
VCRPPGRRRDKRIVADQLAFLGWNEDHKGIMVGGTVNQFDERLVDELERVADAGARL